MESELEIIKPETVIIWHRRGFRLYWTWKSRRKERPRIETEIVQLIKQMAENNPLWGVPRIHGEILKLGFYISESTVMRYVPKKNGKTSGQRWETFLKNHASEIISIDFLTVPTISYRLLYVFIISIARKKKDYSFQCDWSPYC